MQTWTSQPVTVEAVQWTGDNLAEVRSFAGPDFIDAGADGHLWVRNAEGPFQIHPGYWLAREPGAPLVLTSPAAWERHRFRRDAG